VANVLFKFFRRAKERKMNKRSDDVVETSEDATNSDSSGDQSHGISHAISTQMHSELDSVNHVITSLSDQDTPRNPETTSGPEIQSIVQTLRGCTEKYLGAPISDAIKYEPN